jgi:hypothetical protein
VWINGRVFQGFQNKPAAAGVPPATFRLVTGKILYTKVQANQHDVCYVLGISQYQKKADSPIRYIGADIKK